MLSHGLRRDWRSPGITRLVGNHAGCRPAVRCNTWVCARVDSIRVGDGHGNRSPSSRGWKGRGGCSIGRNHSVCSMLIDLIATSCLQANKFSLPFCLSHLLEGIRRDKVGMLLAIPSKKDFRVRRSTSRRGSQRGFSLLCLDISLMSSTSCCLKETFSLIKLNGIVLDMIKESREGCLLV